MRCLLDGVSLCATAAQQGAGHWNRPSGISGSVSYAVECGTNRTGGTWVSCGSTTSADARVTHALPNLSYVKFRVRATVTNPDGGTLTGSWATHVT